MFIQLKFYLLGILSGLEKIVRRIVFLFSFFQQNSRWLTNHMLLSRAWTASPICSKEAIYPGNMLIRFQYDSDITFWRGLYNNLVTVLYFSIINVLCGAGGKASFAPQANLVCVLFRGKRGAVCGKRLTFLYTSPYEHVEYNISGP